MKLSSHCTTGSQLQFGNHSYILLVRWHESKYVNILYISIMSPLILLKPVLEALEILTIAYNFCTVLTSLLLFF